MDFLIPEGFSENLYYTHSNVYTIIYAIYNNNTRKDGFGYIIEKCLCFWNFEGE